MLAGLKKWVPMTLSGRPVTAAMALDVEGARIAREHGVAGRHGIELAEGLLLDLELLEHRLDHDVRLARRFEIEGPPDEPEALLDLLGGEAAARRGVLVVSADGGEPAFEGFLVHLHHRHRDAGIGEAHGDAAAHRSAADDDRPPDVDGLGAAGDVGDLRGLALGEEEVLLGSGLDPAHEAGEDLLLAVHPFVEGQLDRRLDGLDAGLRRVEAAHPPRVLLAKVVEEGRVAARRGHLVVAVADADEGPPLGHRAPGERDGALGEVALHDLVRQAVRQGVAGADGIAAHDHLERLLRPYDAGQALGAAGAGTEPELHLREPESGGLDGDPEVAGKRGLEAPAERGAVDRGHHRLRRVVERVDHLEETRGLQRLVELGDIRPGDEGPACAGEDDGGHRRVLAHLLHGVADALAHVPAEGVDGGIVDGDDGNAVAHFKLNGIRIGGHEGSRAVSLGGSAPTTPSWYHPHRAARPAGAPGRDAPGRGARQQSQVPTGSRGSLGQLPAHIPTTSVPRKRRDDALQRLTCRN